MGRRKVSGCSRSRRASSCRRPNGNDLVRRDLGDRDGVHVGGALLAFRAGGHGLLSTLEVIHHVCNFPLNKDFVSFCEHDSHTTGARIAQTPDVCGIYRDCVTGIRFEEA